MKMKTVTVQGLLVIVWYAGTDFRWCWEYNGIHDVSMYGYHSCDAAISDAVNRIRSDYSIAPKNL